MKKFSIKNQILFLRQQLEENKQYNQLFLRQIETKEKEQEEKKKQIKKNDNIKQKTSFNDIKKNIAEYRKSKKENSEN